MEASAAYSIRPGKCAKPQALLLKVQGRLDTESSDSFRKEVVAHMLEARSAGGLVLDLSGIEYASSTGVGALVLILSESTSDCLQLYLYGVPRQLRMILDLLGFSSFFTMLPSYEAC
jgi:anti-anti-sigma factor